MPLDRLEEAERPRTGSQACWCVIAAISLMVGGIGIMNIMLATVTERTREIGIRRALGAKRRDITLQFLVEAVVQTTIGGLLGVAIGIGLRLSSSPVLCAHDGLFGFDVGTQSPRSCTSRRSSSPSASSIGVGILFGWYPARRAAMHGPDRSPAA